MAARKKKKEPTIQEQAEEAANKRIADGSIKEREKAGYIIGYLRRPSKG